MPRYYITGDEMATHGSLGEFDGNQEEWTSYMERMDQYFTANNITNPVKMYAILLSSCGSSTYKLIWSQVAPDKHTERSYSELVTLVGENYHSKPSMTVQWFTFNNHVRQPGESISTFVAALRQLTEHCEVGPSLEDMLRDHLICGVSDESPTSPSRRPSSSQRRWNLLTAMPGFAVEATPQC